MSLEEAGKVKDPAAAMETCPFCGKAFKRLKSHLPHCKLAGAKSDSTATEQAKKSPKTGTKKALLEAKTKEQYSKNEGEDSMKITKKTQLVKKPQKHLESSSYRTPKTMLEQKENVKTHVEKSKVDHCIDKEGNRSGYHIVEDPAVAADVQSPETSMSLAQTGAIHVAAAQPHTAALSAMPGDSETLKASEDISTWPSHMEEFRGAVEKTGIAGIKLPIYEEVSKVMEDGKENNHCSFGNGFKSSVNGKHSQKPENQYLKLPSEPSSSLLRPTMVSSAYRLKSLFPRHSENAQLLDMSHQLQTPDFEILKSTKKSLEGQLQICDSDALKSTAKSIVDQLQISDSDALKSTAKSIVDQLQISDSDALKSTTKSIVDKLQISDSDALKSTTKPIEDQLQTCDSDALKSMAKSIVDQMQICNSDVLRGTTKSIEDQLHISDSDALKSTTKSIIDQLQICDSDALKGMTKSIVDQLQISESDALKSTAKSIEDQLQTCDTDALKSTTMSIVDQMQICNSNALKSMKKSLEDQLDLTHVNETNTFLPVRDVLSGNRSLGLQWFPELHSNYVLLKIVPGKMYLMSSERTMGKSITPGPADSEFCKFTQPQLSPEVPLTSRRLMDVRIGELPSWLALQRFSVKIVPELGLRAWTQYYNKYINVRKGGIGGLTMILAGYCALSYTWNYHHIRQDRWRKYH